MLANLTAARDWWGREILLYPARAKVLCESDYCARQTRRHYRILEKLEILILVHPANSVRRPPTYRLNVERLDRAELYGRKKSRMTSKEYAQAHASVMRKFPVRESAPRSSIETPKAEKPKNIRTLPRSPKLTTGQRVQLVQRISFLQKGSQGEPRYEQQNPDPGCVKCEGSGRRARSGTVGVCECSVKTIYIGARDPLPRGEAVLVACKSMTESHGVSMERALEAAEDAGFKAPEGGT